MKKEMERCIKNLILLLVKICKLSCKWFYNNEVFDRGALMSGSVRRLSFDMPEEVENVLNEFAYSEHLSKGEALRRAIGLLAIAREQGRKGNCLAVVKERENEELIPIGKITGV